VLTTIAGAGSCSPPDSKESSCVCPAAMLGLGEPDAYVLLDRIPVEDGLSLDHQFEHGCIHAGAVRPGDDGIHRAVVLGAAAAAAKATASNSSSDRRFMRALLPGLRAGGSACRS